MVIVLFAKEWVRQWGCDPCSLSTTGVTHSSEGPDIWETTWFLMGHTEEVRNIINFAELSISKLWDEWMALKVCMAFRWTLIRYSKYGYFGITFPYMDYFLAKVYLGWGLGKKNWCSPNPSKNMQWQLWQMFQCENLLFILGRSVLLNFCCPIGAQVTSHLDIR